MNLFKNLDLRARLFAIFTLIFLLTLILLSVFLRGAARAIELNATSDVIFAEVREFLALKQALSAMELAHNRYEVSQDIVDQATFYGQFYRMDAQIFSLTTGYDDPELLADLKELETGIYSYRDLFAEVGEAMLAEDWNAVTEKDAQIYEFLPSLFNSLDALVVKNQQQLADVNAEIEWFQFTILFGALAGLALFAFLAGVALWMIHRQINNPLKTLNHAASQLAAGQFDPASVRKLAERSDEIGAIAASLLETAGELAGRQSALAEEAAQIKAKIR